MRRTGLWIVGLFGLAACGTQADAAPQGTVTVAPITVAPATVAPPADALVLPSTVAETLPPTTVEIPPPSTETTLPPETTVPETAPPTAAPETTLPVETTVPPSTEPPLTLPLITLSTVAAPMPTLPAAPPPPTTLPDFTSSGGGGGGGSLGRIIIPKLGINSGLRSGIDMGTLNQGPGHWPGTALPGNPGNVVIAGHRTSHGGIFRYINSLGSGDQIILSNSTGDHVYVVTGVQIVPPTATWIIGQGGGSRVTLFACHPPGSTAQRIVVFGRLAG